MFNPFDIPNLNIDGEVRRKYFEYHIFIVIIICFYIISLPALINFVKIENDIIKYICFFNYLWVYLSMFILYIFSKHFKYNFLIILCFFPFLFPIYALTKLFVKYLKSKYPNGDDEDSLKKFERIQKIKKII